jgi:hypothetical protein
MRRVFSRDPNAEVADGAICAPLSSLVCFLRCQSTRFEADDAYSSSKSVAGHTIPRGSDDTEDSVVGFCSDVHAECFAVHDARDIAAPNTLIVFALWPENEGNLPAE